MKVGSVVITTKKKSPEASRLSLEIKAWLEEQGIMVRMVPAPDFFAAKEPGMPEPDLIVVLGGDGTILSHARKMMHTQVPFLGVNMGKVGFMAETSPLTWKKDMSMALNGELAISRRTVLKYELIKDREIIEKGCAINEVVINRGELARLITVELNLPGGSRQNVRSDGVIFSTPTGSTAYCVSAGGPLVHPDLEAIVITSICPFLHDFKPLVLPASQTIDAGIAWTDSEAFVTVDVQLGIRLMPEHRIRISRHERDFMVLCKPGHGFVSRLEAKGFLQRRQ